ncbi:SMI1/KNR4 family protein [Hymenobacter jejuensis]|uniref:SMI1/KNR4 family protein n=1 Tax=Hymenobacter jejuensis TaxID=2502781 RepID=A0A5B8A6T0_9BACT|nr:SMI1/KNR4 family protein [Hymenobacter jejuensis]QDA62092.1 SMI1/KNR4 family protein [Hymenobacter jejuensis]
MDESLPTPQAVSHFVEAIDFKLPVWHLTLLSENYEQEFDLADGKYLHLWPLADLIEANQDYQADENYPGFFLIGTYGGGEACAIEKETGKIYTVPFIGDIPEDAVLVGNTLDDLIKYLHQPW